MGIMRSDRGAAAVEFALVLPILIVVTFGIFAFGHAFHAQTVLDNAAREAVRVYALEPGTTRAADARAAAVAASSPLVPITAGQVALTPATGCPVTQNARATITLTNFELLGGFFGPLTLTGSGSMRCNG